MERLTLASEPDGESIEVSADFVRAVVCKQPSAGYTHTFYKYPARFSPQFAAAAIAEFSQPGDVVLDPFVGSGTTLIEAMIAGRSAIGSDISALATFIAKTKTRGLRVDQAKRILAWSRHVVPQMSASVAPASARAGDPRQNHVAWPVRNVLANTLAAIDALEHRSDKDFLRCALLGAAQEALDNTNGPPTAPDFREMIMARVEEHCAGALLLYDRLSLAARADRPKVVCLNVPANKLRASLWRGRISKAPTLVVTSPPYPQVHVLYHRWQVEGRRETSAPFWIIGSRDGKGEAYYTMGGRHRVAEQRYFDQVQQSFRAVHSVLADRALVVQLIAFSQPETQLPRYLASMREAGFAEQCYRLPADVVTDRLWRDVPLRKWYASLRGRLHASREVLLIHRKA